MEEKRNKDIAQKRTLIVAGGELSPAFLSSYLESHEFQDIIAADRGVDVLLAADRGVDVSLAADRGVDVLLAADRGVDVSLAADRGANVSLAADCGADAPIAGRFTPDLIVGDFDSTSEKSPEKLKLIGAKMEVYPCEKDFSDLESALKAAIRRGSEDITILGGTGGRLDHFLANVMDLRIPLKAGIPARLVNEQNVIYLKKESFEVRKTDSFGVYFSLIPLTGRIEHLCLRGFKYSGEDITLDQDFASYGVSNEIVCEKASVEFSGGILFVVESKDSSC